MEDTELMVLGIVTGILTTTIILLAKSFFYQVVVPWYLSVTYKGVDLAGKWVAQKEGHTFTLEIKQYAHKIQGVLIISQDEKDKLANASHYINGEVWEGYLSLHSNTVDKRRLSYGNLLLKIESGQLLKGIYTARRFAKLEAIGIQPSEVSFERNL